MDIREAVVERAARARAATRDLIKADAALRDTALRAMAGKLRANAETIQAENAKDMETGQEKGLSSAMLDRLRLDDKRIEDMAVALEEIAAFDDPLADTLAEWERPNGLRIQKVPVPIGVVGIVYESRPNVTVDSVGLCLKAGNAVVLRGGSEAIHSNVCLAGLLAEAAAEVGLPASCVEIVPVTDRQAVLELVKLDQYLNLVVPRGGKQLIRTVKDNATVPVLEHERGMTQIYVDAACDVDMAVSLVHNAKVQRPGVCNAVENLYVHEHNTKALKAIVGDLQAAGVEIRADAGVMAVCDGCTEATAEDWDTEYLDLILTMGLVSSLDEALDCIAEHSSGLTEAIITDSEANAARFLREVDSACVYHNASTRFTDGGQFGMGAEIGISTGKMHARGPVGVRELTSYKYVIHGNGQVRG
ncbi:glutamate-5-semialdehyde dehydrogenase [bacterium]|nr:glutamate-5-semialdehyde dehydrogenase [bacterium]